MPFRRAQAYDRQRLLEAAAQAKARNKRHKAIALYRRVLALERHNLELHARLAPLLAETGQSFDAWIHYRTTAQAALREGREDKALAVYREASQRLPREIEAWLSLARMQARRGDEAGAVETLLEGSRSFRTPYLRPQAIHLLRRARALQPWHFETVIELATLLGSCDQRDEAGLLLDALAQRSRGYYLRSVRRAELRIRPGPAGLWRYLQTWWQSADQGDGVDARVVDESGVVSLDARRVHR